MEAHNKRGDNIERIITFRLTDSEIRELGRLQKKHGLSRSDLIRKFLLEEKGPLIVNLKEFLEGINELAAEQGRNVKRAVKIIRKIGTHKKAGAIGENV